MNDGKVVCGIPLVSKHISKYNFKKGPCLGGGGDKGWVGSEGWGVGGREKRGICG